MAHLVETLEELEEKLRESYNNGDTFEFNKNKKLFIQVQKKIDDAVKWMKEFLTQ